MSREQLMEMTRREIENLRQDRIDLVDDVYSIPTQAYTDPARWELEVERIFKRLPMALGFSCEMRSVGSYRAMEVAGVPVLMVRGEDGTVRAFVNMCSHRGNYVVLDEAGETKLFHCNYHAWTYDLEGELRTVFDGDNFGEIDRSCHGLTPLPTAERAGLIWVTLNPNSTVEIDAFLSGYGGLLELLGFEESHLVGRREMEGPNWKVAYDGYRDFYHLPILHRETFGPNQAYQADYYNWGPHVRVVAPKGYARLADTPEDQWDDDSMTGGVWTIFPNISIAGDTARGFMVSQMFPGKTVGESHTTQNFLRPTPLEDQDPEEVAQHMDFMVGVVRDEDYYTGFHVQQALATGAKEELMFGRNEGGGQLFHRWVDALIEASDKELPALLANGVGELGTP